MAQELVETEGQELEEGQVSEVIETAPPASEQPPATPAASEDFETSLQAARAEAWEQGRRTGQSAKDRELARLAKEARDQERALREFYESQLQQAGVDPAQIRQHLDLQAKAAYADRMLSQQQAEAAARERAQELIVAAGLDEYGITPADARLLDLPDWQTYAQKLKEVRRQEEARRAEAAKVKQAQDRKATVAARVTGGGTAVPAPGASGAAPANREQEKATLWNEYQSLLNAGAPKGKRKAVEDRLRALGEDL